MQNINIQSCNNPTFTPTGANLLAETAPYPPACDKQGPTQCTNGTGGAAPSPSPSTAGAATSSTGGTSGTGSTTGHHAARGGDGDRYGQSGLGHGVGNRVGLGGRAAAATTCDPIHRWPALRRAVERIGGSDDPTRDHRHARRHHRLVGATDS